jgi:hypothetical protein
MMAKLILHKDGAYNLYTTIADGACYESALTLQQLEEVIRFESGEQGMRELPARLERAHKTGCSSMHGETLEECISCNRSGPDETKLSAAEFVEKYMTLAPNVELSGGRRPSARTQS